MAKHLSRSKRRDAACADLRKTAEAARDLAASIQSETNPTLEFMKTVVGQLETLDISTDELEELKSEIEDWRDNMPESLQGGDKYSTLDETANCLDSVIDELQGLDLPEFKAPSPRTTRFTPQRLHGEECEACGLGFHSHTNGACPQDEEAIEAAATALAELPDTLEEYADAIEAQADEADNAEFPGMMG